MKNTILIKHHSSVQLAHLYEHLFLIKANELLNQRGLFKWVDFTLNGTTFEQGGVISVDFKTYNDMAADCLPDILKLRLEFDEPLIAKALMQIHAEELYELKAGSLAVIKKQLGVIDSMEWQSLDELKIWNAKGIKRTSYPLHLTRVESETPVTTKVSLELNQGFSDKDPLNLALFNIMARFILITATYDIAKETGSYSYQVYSQLSGKKVVVELLTASIFRSKSPDMQEIITYIQDTIQNMKHHGAFKRLEADLQGVSYYRNGPQAPDYEQILNDLGLVVGSKGWRMVDEEYIENVLKHVCIEVRRSQNILQAPLKND